MTEAKSATVTQVIGERLRELREKSGFRQEDIARDARERFELQWTRATVAGLENASRRITIEEVIVLCLILRCQPPELVPVSLPNHSPNQWISLTPGTRITRQILREFFSGLFEGWPPRLDIDSPEERAFRGKAPVYLSQKLMFPDEVIKAARKLKIGESQLAAAATKLWGRSLPTERDRRIADWIRGKDPRTIQALRGHVTRALLRELGSYLRPKRKKKGGR